ncbi:MAG: TrkA C-terminal domain-containing protein [Gemmatimonadota bacterium]
MDTERRTVKDLLVLAKDVAELMVDLAYAAVFFDDRDLAREVFRLEEEISEAIVELRMICLIAARTREDAEGLAGVLSLASSIETIADSAEEIARVVLKEVGVPRQLRDDLRHAAEIVTRVRIRAENAIEGEQLTDLALPAETGMWVIAIRRDVRWIFGPAGDEILQEGDLVFFQGPPEGVDRILQLAGSPAQEPSPSPPAAESLSNLDRAVDLVVELKNTSEIAVGLAYSAILLRDRKLAAEVSVIEEASDELYHELEGWVLRAASEVRDPTSLRGLIHISGASERIVDAAKSMTRLIEAEDLPHPIIAQALAEADEIVMEAIVAPGSEVAGRALGEMRIHTETGMEVLAIQRGSRWVYRPRASRRLDAEDRLLAIGPEEGASKLRTLCGDLRPEGEKGWYEPEEEVEG